MIASLPALDVGALARAADSSFRPQLFRRMAPAERESLDALLASDDVLFVHDTLTAQIEELLETRSPDRRIERDELARLAAVHAGDLPADHGTWVYYPWSRRLVHVLPPGEYEELRTSRNRNKITRQEQTRLAGLRIGVAGLSVGQSTAVTLALEGIGGLYRLADFDTLSLSNMNRLRAGVHSIGVNKAVLAAREIFEINPYARVEVFAQGIHDHNLAAFFAENEPLDLLFEECDDLKIKLRLRQEARKRGIAVVMETSDRGLLDIERFDREPERPLFHGLVPELDPAKVAGLTAYEKIPIVLGIVGRETMSARLAASLVDVDATLKTWPQLASAVALGGAINADVARRIGLGQLLASGRFFVDLEALVSTEVAPSSEVAASSAPTPSASPDAAPAHIDLGPSEPVSGAVLEELLALATRAPSGGNAQPWRFTYSKGGCLRLWHDETRSRSFLDFEHRASHLAFGALAETLRLAAARLGVGWSLRAKSQATPALVFEGQLGGAPVSLSADERALANCIEARVTHRGIGSRRPIARDNLVSLQNTAKSAGAELLILTAPEALEAVGHILGSGDRLRVLSPVMHREMMSEIRWSPDEAARTRDGLDLATLGLRPSDEAALRVIAAPAVTRALREVGGGQGLTRSARQAVAGAGAIGLLRVPFAGPSSDLTARQDAYFRGGIALARVWLRATSLAVAFQPMTALLYLFARLDTAGDSGLDIGETQELESLRGKLGALFRTSADAYDVLLFRMVPTQIATPRSLRRGVPQILAVEP